MLCLRVHVATCPGLFTRFRNPKDKRDFVTAGAAVGIATAFGAPIGGLLFVFEEVASFWQHELGWQIFFACMVAVLSLDTFRSAEAALYGGAFGWFSGAASTVLYEVGHFTQSLCACCVVVHQGSNE